MSDQVDCWVEPIEKPWDPETLLQGTVAYLGVSGMGCSGCELRVRNGLLQLDGVLLADVDWKNQSATAVYDPRRANTEELLQAIEHSGGDDGRMFWGTLYFVMPAEESI